MAWKKRKYQTNPKSLYLFENVINGKLVVIWVAKSSNPDMPFRFGGANGRGYIKDVYFKTKLQAVKYAKEYKENHK
jgi:hypothetical protein